MPFPMQVANGSEVVPLGYKMNYAWVSYLLEGNVGGSSFRQGDTIEVEIIYGCTGDFLALLKTFGHLKTPSNRMNPENLRQKKTKTIKL